MDFEFNQDTLEQAKTIAAAAAAEAQDVDKYFLDYTQPIPRPTPVICDPTNPNRVIVSEQNLFLIIGEAKSYKSFCASLLTIDFFKQHPDRTCILIDTEQAAWNVQNVAKRVCDGMGWDYAKAYQSGKLKIAHLRPYSKRERLDAVKAIIEKYKPYLCIVDGIRDLVESTNDDVICSSVIDQFMKWSEIYNCAIGTILHTNKDGETAKGHLGSELLAKCELTLLCKQRAEGGARVTCYKSRNESIEAFDLEIDDRYVPKRVTYTKKQEEDDRLGTEKETTALRALKKVSNRSKDEWVNDIRTSQAPSLAKQTAERYFTDFVQFGFLIPDNREMTHFSHKDATDRKQTQQVDTQMSFEEDNNDDPF